MRSIIHVLKISLLAGWFALLTVTSTAAAAYNESGGVVVMEVESEPLPAQGWRQATSVVGRSDNASILGSFYGSTLNSTSTPGRGLISYKVAITTPGDYQLQWHSLISVYNSTEGTFNSSTETTEHNDSFARMLNPSGVSITAQAVPGGANGGVPDKTGSASENWYKVYRNGSGWIWDAKNQDNYPLPSFGRSPQALTPSKSALAHQVMRLIASCCGTATEALHTETRSQVQATLRPPMPCLSLSSPAAPTPRLRRSPLSARRTMPQAWPSARTS